MNKRYVLNVFLCLSFIIMSSPALAFCMSPNFFENAPSAPGSFERPRVPSCMSNRDDPCDDHEFDAYEREVSDYIGKLNDFSKEATDFGNASIDYAKKSQEYAACEAEETRTQHE